ncbi:pteridine reductase [Sedimenticola thiotaurini]|uniref:Pteridine reductase n=1 Tax=Sedimenticola thiotaurini TaxID=1543721 RepID=A0A0F7K0U0_9GAMM|nr:pteridine reductase [Sedimenticola thiotaurini]AKH21517.1 pteridine reductase [Sedimenticola thiotaurini]
MSQDHPPVALITGAAQRIGATIARHLHQRGLAIALHYHRSQAPAAALKEELEQARPDSVQLIQADLNESRQLARIIQQVEQWRGRLDLLVNNASSFYPTPLSQLTGEQWDDLMGTNLKAPFFLAIEAAPLLRASRGAIINLVDIHAERPLKNHPVYSMAKAGNAMMVKSLARELGPEIRVNGVAPGAILWPEQAMSDPVKQEILARTALERTGTPADIAGAVCFLALEAPYVTGQILAVDGGRTVQQ